MRFVIEGRLWGLNDVLNTCKSSKFGQQTYSRYKRETEQHIGWYIKKWLGNWKTDKKVYLKFLWVEPNKRRDLDNIAFGKKFVQDALVKHGVIPNDGWKNVLGFTDEFAVDSEFPRIEVEIIEVD